MLFNTGGFDRCTTVITWGFPVRGSHWLPHINSYFIAGFLPSDHLLVLHLGEGEGHCESTVSYPRTQWVIPARGQNWTSQPFGYHASSSDPYE